MPDDVGERRLVRAWQSGLPHPLRTTDGRVVHVVYRGRCPGGAGPDVRGALLAFDDGTLIEGDVEFHQRVSDWYAHGHQGDARYRGVVLHVVLVADASSPLGPSGQPIPTLVVSPPERLLPDDLPPSADDCHRRARERESTALSTVLDDLGDRRLMQRACRFEAELTRLTPEQLAYEALFDALGFSRNRTAFVRLAQAVPVSLLTALVGRRASGEALDLVQAILFGVAGLLPSQRGSTSLDWEADLAMSGLEEIWNLYRREWDGIRLDAADWVFGGVRPPNYPTRRIATAAHLIVRYRDAGLDRALLAPLRHGQMSDGELDGLFLVEDASGYWSTHCDFGRSLPGGRAALLGRDRARDAVVNVVLPLALAVAAETTDQALAEAAWAVYRSFPRSSSYQATAKLASEIGATDGLVRTARRQQGLLYLLRNHCERAACATCPLSRSDE
jgi:hypothetical protein